jgi:hypothetical protein
MMAPMMNMATAICIVVRRPEVSIIGQERRAPNCGDMRMMGREEWEGDVRMHQLGRER